MAMLPLDALLALALVSKRMFNLVMAVLQDRYRDAVRPFVGEDFLRLSRCLRLTGSVLVGDLLTQIHDPYHFVSGAGTTRMMLAVPRKKFADVVKFFQSGFDSGRRYYMPGDFHDGPDCTPFPFCDNEMGRIVVFRSRDTEIYLIRSLTPSPFSVVCAAKATPWIAYATPNSFFFGYAKHWEQKLCLLTGREYVEDFRHELVDSYAKDGWSSAETMANTKGDPSWRAFRRHTCGVSPDCPLTDRSSSHDGLFVRFSSPDDDEKKSPFRNRSVGGYRAVWRVGGHNCRKPLMLHPGDHSVRPIHHRFDDA